MKLVREIKRFTLLIIKQVSHKDVTYSKGNIGNKMIIIFYVDSW